MLKYFENCVRSPPIPPSIEDTLMNFWLYQVQDLCLLLVIYSSLQKFRFCMLSWAYQKDVKERSRNLRRPLPAKLCMWNLDVY